MRRVEGGGNKIENERKKKKRQVKDENESLQQFV